MRTVSLAFVALLLACNSVITPTAPPLPGELVAHEFHLAQEKVANEYNRLGAWTLSPDDFKWHPHDGPFRCGDVKPADGCYSTGSHLIEYNIHTSWVIRHEAGHGILHLLGDDRWRCFGEGC